MFLFIIDTNHYAGNFEREMAGYLTGHVADCGTGQKEADIFHEELGLSGLYDENHPFKNVMKQHNSHGNLTPAVVYETPGFFSNGVGGHYCKRDPQCEEQALKDRNAHWAKEAEKWELMVNSEEARKDRHLHLDFCRARYNEYIARTKEPLKEYPVYQSVAIFFETKLTEDQIKLLRNRIAKFPVYWATSGKGIFSHYNNPCIDVLGARIIEQKEVLVEELNW